MFTPTVQNFLSYNLVYFNVFISSAIALLAIKHFFIKNWGAYKELVLILFVYIFTGSLTLLFRYEPHLLSINLFTTVLLLIIAKRLFKNHTFSGINYYLANIYVILVGVFWGLNFLLSLDISLMTKLLIFSTAPLLFLTVPSNLIQIVEHYDVLCRLTWKRPRHSYPERKNGNSPMVSLHVPTYNEPPDLVIETLNVLSRLNYPNYEVIVIDNNTYDEKLWKPVEKHCNRLGPKFRFFHVENLKGAKAGALNYIHPFINKNAEIIGVIDADYHSRSDFLNALVGYFEDPNIGFVQTPHDYRNWEVSAFLTMCYWEYKIFFYTTLVSLNESSSSLTVGTMCLIRKKALEDAGGWAEWCVTEDSELAIRIHNAGYKSIYIDEPFGKGLIPETFEGYKKQRYRWTAGPVQEFQHHFKKLVGISKTKTTFSFSQRIHHLNHGMQNIIIGLSIPLLILSLGVISSMVWHREVIYVPFELWLSATVVLLSGFVLDILIHKAVIKPNFKQFLGKTFAMKALNHVISLAALSTLLTGSAKWVRTNKFKEIHSYKSALYSTKEELVIGAGLIVFIVASFVLLPYPGLALMFLIGIFYISISYLSAPVMAIIGAWSLKKETKNEKKLSSIIKNLRVLDYNNLKFRT